VARPVKIGEFHEPNRKLLGRTIWHFDILESTNETAKELLEDEMEEGLVIWADRQSAGRGRQGRAWASPLGGLYMSAILSPTEAHAWVLGLLMGMPVVKALRHFGVFAGLKYPNDAVYQGRKIAGVLSEGVYRRDRYHVIVGIGVNTNVGLDQLPSDVQATATTLKREVNLFVANDEFLDYLLNQMDDLYSRYRNTKVDFLLKDYRGQCTTIGKRVSATTSKGTVTGKAYDIAPNGALIIIDDENRKHEFVDGQLTIQS
jgi:BirA family transcriptional regulator, biotin operon repressor / biotin---[acetyl-CoA-carboxylase] ligase